MAFEFRHERRIEFSDTDMAGIVHFANFFRFMEATEHAFVRSLGHTLHHARNGRMLGFARLSASCDYESPLHYQDLVEIRLAVREKSATTLTYDFVFRRIEDGDGKRVDRVSARGSLTVVCVTRSGEEPIRRAPIPDEIAAAIEVAPSESLET